MHSDFQCFFFFYNFFKVLFYLAVDHKLFWLCSLWCHQCFLFNFSYHVE